MGGSQCTSSDASPGVMLKISGADGLVAMALGLAARGTEGALMPTPLLAETVQL